MIDLSIYILMHVALGVGILVAALVFFNVPKIFQHAGIALGAAFLMQTYGPIAIVIVLLCYACWLLAGIQDRQSAPRPEEYDAP
jgi:hypothetical protein